MNPANLRFGPGPGGAARRAIPLSVTTATRLAVVWVVSVGVHRHNFATAIFERNQFGEKATVRPPE